jgi:hypothetical protein
MQRAKRRLWLLPFRNVTEFAPNSGSRQGDRETRRQGENDCSRISLSPLLLVSLSLLPAHRAIHIALAFALLHRLALVVLLLAAADAEEDFRAALFEIHF